MTKSEQLLSAFSEDYFFKELVLDNLHFIPEGSSKIELADLIINLGDIILAVQPKERNDENQTNDPVSENNWLKDRCKEAKKQVKRSLDLISSGALPAFQNKRGQGVYLQSDAKIIPLVVFDNNQITDYPHILRKHADSGMDIRKFFQENLAEYERRWRIKVRQFQIPIFLENTDAMWQIRFDDVIANALTLGPLREMEAKVKEQQKEKLLPFVQGEVKLKYLTTLVAYYLANKPEDSDWVVLPSTNFNCYFGSTVFSKKVLREITGKVIQRSDTSYSSGRYRVLEEFL